jgi:hypothetical protein
MASPYRCATCSGNSLQGSSHCSGCLTAQGSLIIKKAIEESSDSKGWCVQVKIPVAKLVTPFELRERVVTVCKGCQAKYDPMPDELAELLPACVSVGCALAEAYWANKPRNEPIEYRQARLMLFRGDTSTAKWFAARLVAARDALTNSLRPGPAMREPSSADSMLAALPPVVRMRSRPSRPMTPMEGSTTASERIHQRIQVETKSGGPDGELGDASLGSDWKLIKSPRPGISPERDALQPQSVSEDGEPHVPRKKEVRSTTKRSAKASEEFLSS